MDTLTIPLPPEVKAQLEGVAAERRLPAEECALELLTQALGRRAEAPGADSRNTQQLLPEPGRLAAIDEAHGLLAGSPFTVNDFLREKHEGGR